MPKNSDNTSNSIVKQHHKKPKQEVQFNYFRGGQKMKKNGLRKVKTILKTLTVWTIILAILIDAPIALHAATQQGDYMVFAQERVEAFSVENFPYNASEGELPTTMDSNPYSSIIRLENRRYELQEEIDRISALLYEEDFTHLESELEYVSRELAAQLANYIAQYNITTPAIIGLQAANSQFAEIMPFNEMVPEGLNLGGRTTHNVTNEAELRTRLNETTTRAIRLMNDISVTGAVMPVRGDVIIFSNTATLEQSFMINRTGGGGTAAPGVRTLSVDAGTAQLWNVHVTSPSNATWGGGVFVDGGHLHLHEGSRISNARHMNDGGTAAASRRVGGGVAIVGGQLTMHGGVIEHNVSAANTTGHGGGGVLVHNGTTFTMHGGVIRYNESHNTGGGVQVAATGNSNTSRANFNMTGGSIYRNTASGAGGAIHLNSNGHADLSEDASITLNSAGSLGGAIRIYGTVSTTASLRVRDDVEINYNTAGTHGGGISLRHRSHHINMANWNGTLHGNTAGGDGGAIHMDNQAGTGTPASVTPALTITGSGSITGNTANNGGAIHTHLDNLPAAAAATRLVIAPSITFDNNVARVGMRVDENLGFRNATHLPIEGSLRWVGVNPGAPGGPAVEWRDHLFNNYDVNVRDWIYLRPVDFEAIGTAGDDSVTTAFVTRVGRFGTLAAAPPLSANFEIESGDLVPVRAEAAQTSQVSYVVAYYPWNTYRPWGPTGTPARSWSANGVNVANASTTLANRNVTSVPNNTAPYIVRVTIDYRYHDIRFEANPSTATTGGTVDGQVSVVRHLRESSDTYYSANTPGGDPIGAPPVTEARDGWIFIHWTHNGTVITAEEIATMYVTGPLTFVAVFEELVATSIAITPDSRTLGNLEEGTFTAIVLNQLGYPMPNQESFVINWSSANTANVTVAPASNPAGQGNTTTATATLLAAPESSTIITATLGSDTTIYAEATVNVTLNQVPSSISVTPTPSTIFRGGEVELTAVVLDQFGTAMPNQDSFVINWASATPANVVVDLASSAAGQPNTTTATATEVAVMGSSNNVTATLNDTTISATAIVEIGMEYDLTVTYIAHNTPTNKTVTVDGVVMALPTGELSRLVRPDLYVELYAGTVASQTFLGWFRYEDAPAKGDTVTNLPANPNHSFYMPVGGADYVAVWGNQLGEVSQLNGFDIIYHANGGNNPPASQTNRTPGEHGLTLPPGGMYHVDVNGNTLRFVGWSLTQINEIFAVGSLPTDLSIVTSITIVDADVTVYAVWQFADILINADYGTEGEVLVDVNLPSDEYEITVDEGSNTIVIRIPEEYEGNVSVGRLPSEDWDYEIVQDGDDVVVVLIPPAGSYLYGPCDTTGNIYVYHYVTFLPGSHGILPGEVSYVESRVRRNTTLTAGHVPTVDYSTNYPKIGWESNVLGVIEPVGHEILGPITFTAIFDGEFYYVRHWIVINGVRQATPYAINRISASERAAMLDLDLPAWDGPPVVLLPGEEAPTDDASDYYDYVIDEEPTDGYDYATDEMSTDGQDYAIDEEPTDDYDYATDEESTDSQDHTTDEELCDIYESSTNDEVATYYEVAEEATELEEENEESFLYNINSLSLNSAISAILGFDFDFEMLFVPMNSSIVDLVDFLLNHPSVVMSRNAIMETFAAYGILFDGYDTSSYVFAGGNVLDLIYVITINEYVPQPPTPPTPPTPPRPPAQQPEINLPYIPWSPRTPEPIEDPTDEPTEYYHHLLIYEDYEGELVPDLSHIETTRFAYVIGDQNGLVRPTANITRAEATTIFFRLITDEHRARIWSQTNSFDDVAIDNWFNNPISTMARGGLFSNMQLGGSFNPNQALTRAEFATMVVNYLGLSKAVFNGEDAFTDINGHWANNAINLAHQQGWIRGFGDGTFRPDQLVTRAEVAALINRALGRLPQFPSDLLDGMVTFADNANENAWYFLYIQSAANSYHHEMKACGVYETWTELITPRNWRSLERPYSQPHHINR